MIPQPTTTTHTPEERKAIADAFQAAKPLLWGGSPLLLDDTPSAYKDGIDEYICHALAYSRHPARYAAKEVIHKRIYPYTSYETWLLDHYSRGQLTKQFLQTLRHQWLDALIKEFSE